MEEKYYDIERRTTVKEDASMFRRKFLTYEQAEIIYSISHRKIRDLAAEAGAIYRFNEVSVLVNREIFDEYLEKFRQPSTLKEGGK